MINFCHIAPTAALERLVANRTHHLTLAHLVESDPAYAKFYHDVDRQVMILDNSAFEMYKEGKPYYPSDRLVEIGRMVRANFVVMSDYPNQPWEVTRDSAITLAPQFRKAGLGTFYVPQSEIGDIDGLIKSFMWAAESTHVDYIGASILAIPNAFGVEKDNKLQRFLARWAFFQLLEKQGYFELQRKNKKRMHILGMVDGPNEIALLKPWAHYIHTWDSSAAPWLGLNGMIFDNSPTGRIEGKFEMPVDFAVKEGYYSELEIEKAMYNIQYIDSLCK